MDSESLLGGGVGLVLVLGNVSSGPVRTFADPGPISEETWLPDFATCWILSH